jgi:hypothetical protein
VDAGCQAASARRRLTGLIEQALVIGLVAQALDVSATLDEEQLGIGHEHGDGISLLYSLHCQVA